ncbi:hypothetical protein L083_2574 [Actinoplanes sp. N902-109]|nr:hypothetical protein L083_2574 [Actinoplanes sp. N902-109]
MGSPAGEPYEGIAVTGVWHSTRDPALNGLRVDVESGCDIDDFKSGGVQRSG